MVQIAKISDEDYWQGSKDIPELQQGLLKELGISKEKYKDLREQSIDLIKPLEGAEDFLRRLNQRYTLTILSNNSYDWGEKVLDDLGYSKYFHSIVFSHNIGFAKPDKKMFEIALEKVNDKVSQNSEVLFIDDQDKNFPTPEDMGIKTMLFTSYQETLNDLTRYK